MNSNSTSTSSDDDSSGDERARSGVITSHWISNEHHTFPSETFDSEDDDEEEEVKKDPAPNSWVQESNQTSWLSEDSSDESSAGKSNLSDIETSAKESSTSFWSPTGNRSHFSLDDSTKKKKKSEDNSRNRDTSSEKKKKKKRSHDQSLPDLDENPTKKRKKSSLETKHTSPSHTSYGMGSRLMEGMGYKVGEGFGKKGRQSHRDSSSEDAEDNVKIGKKSFGTKQTPTMDTSLHDKGRRIMEGMGYKTGEGLGKKGRRSHGDSSSEDNEDHLKMGNKSFGTKQVPSLDTPLNDNKGRRIMERMMGYKDGEGLGKHSQGRVDPVELSKQKGRRGLGHSLPELDAAVVNWDPTKEIVDVREEVSWLDGSSLEELDLEVLRGWKQEGTRNLDIESMNEFCDPDVLKGVLNAKSIFDRLEGEDMRKARTRSNPFETIGSGIFLNRAAMKMANMDAMFDFMFTNPLDEDGNPMVSSKELLYFADVCAGPGGFSEYILWRKKWRAKGFGFTLKGQNDFKLSDFLSGPCETFEPYYGVKDDGNIFHPDNITSLRKFVLEATGKGVHFMMADGGFSVDGQENIQELLSKQLYLTQCLVALSIVRTGGHFVCKLFDLFSPFSAGLVYLMYRSFKSICLFKPNTSRPANSERYIICKWKRDDCDSIRQYMFELNETLNELGSSSKTDVNYCVPNLELTSDSHFFDYLADSNNKLGERQIISLMKIAAFCNDTSLHETRQAKFRDKCLALWKVPDKFRKMDRTTAEEATTKILPLRNKGQLLAGLLTKSGTKLSNDNMDSSFPSIYDWNCVVLGSDEGLTFYLGLGRSKIFRWSGSRWVKEPNPNFELSPGTMVYGEMVTELIGEGRSQRKLSALHIFDAVSLGYDEVISQKHYNERYELCCLYETSLKRHTQTNMSPVRVIRSVPLERINYVFESLTYRLSKGNDNQLVVEGEDYSYIPKGIVFFNATKKPWSRTISRSTGFYYYFSEGKESKYEKHRPAEANASVQDCIEEQRLWRWQEGVGIFNEEPKPGVIHKDHIIKFVQRKK